MSKTVFSLKSSAAMELALTYAWSLESLAFIGLIASLGQGVLAHSSAGHQSEEKQQGFNILD